MREATSSGSTLYYFAADHLGSTSLTMDASGTKIGEMKYYPFGEMRYTWGGTPTDRRFTGQCEENGLGSLYDFNARMYSPVLGRFLSADSIVPDGKNPQQFNRYAYVLNNPLRYVDPSGNFSQDQIEEYLKKQHGDKWLSYMLAWQNDKIFWGMLGAAVIGDALFAPTTHLGRGVFKQDGSTFSFDSNCQGSGHREHFFFKFPEKIANLLFTMC